MKNRYLYQRFNVFGTLLLSTLLPCLLATIILAAVFLPMMTNTAGSNDEAYEKVMLYAVSSQFENLCNSIDEAVSVVEKNNWIHSLYIEHLKGHTPDYTSKVTIAADLSQACIRSQAKSLSFKFYDDTVLYNNRGVLENSDYYRLNFSDNIHYHFFLSDTQTPSFSSVNFGGTEYLLYQTPFRDIDGGRYKGEINLLFHSGNLGAKLIRAAESKAAAFRITDMEGNSLWEYDAGLFDEETVTLSTISNSGQFYFCVDVPVSIHNQTRNTVGPAMLLTLAVSLLISAALSYVLSRATYRPLQQIVWKFVGKDLQPNNDFAALERVFDRILLEKREVESCLDHLRPIARQKVLGGLLDGTVFLSDSIVRQLEQCQLQFHYDRFNVIALDAPFSKLNEDEVNNTAELALEMLVAHLHEQLPLRAYLYYENSDHYQILVNYESWEDLQSYLSLLSVNCKQYFQKYTLADNLHIGVGQAVFSPEEIYRAAEQADTAIHVATLNRLDQIMYYSELVPDLNHDYFYPLSEEMLLSRSIANGNMESAKELLCTIIETNQKKPNLSPKCLWLLYMDLSFTVVRSGQSLGIALPFPDSKDSLIGLEEIGLRVEAMIEEIAREIQMRRQKNVNSTEQQILNYIDEHIYDSDLSLNSIAEHFHKSDTYISAIFREQRGTNYNNYVNQTRILRAIHLISDEKMDVNAVWPMVGYVSLSTFRRNFTKYAKCNPGDIIRGEEL